MHGQVKGKLHECMHEVSGHAKGKHSTCKHISVALFNKYVTSW